MQRRGDSGRREDLLNASIAYILENGVADLSLRPLAAQVGSKARLLIYHFGSKDALLAEAMTVVRARVQKAFAEIVDSERQRKPSAIIRTFWTWATSRQHQKFLRLFFEIHGLALQRPEQYGPYLEKAVSSWVELMVQVLPESLSLARRRALATLAVTTAIGLLLDYLSSGDKKRVTEALDLFAGSFDELLAKA
jgi:AcrR family transcriptional regulator